jgi:hypothetical protein
MLHIPTEGHIFLDFVSFFSFKVGRFFGEASNRIVFLMLFAALGL